MQLERERTNDGNIIALVTDYGENITNYGRQNGLTYGSDSIRLLMENTARAGFNTAIWRVSNINFNVYHSKVKEIFNVPEMFRMKCDPLEEAVAHARANGLNIYAYMTLFDESYEPPGPPEEDAIYGRSKFARDHPRFCWKHRYSDDYIYGLLDFYYPEVRAYFLEQVKEVLAYGVDGVYLDVARTHSGAQKVLSFPLAIPAFLNYGYNPEPCAEAKKVLGFDPAIDTVDKLNNYKLNEPLDDVWQQFRGSFLTLFMKEASEYIHRHGKKVMAAFYPDSEAYLSHAGVHGRIPLGRLHIDWRTWVKEGYVDEINLLGEHRRFETDDWIGHSRAQFEPYMARHGLKVSLGVATERSIEEAKETLGLELPVSLPRLELSYAGLTPQARAETAAADTEEASKPFYDLLGHYIRKSLHCGADGIVCFESAWLERYGRPYWNALAAVLAARAGEGGASSAGEAP